jgi:ribonuclease D
VAARLSLAARVDLEGLAAAARAGGRLGVDTEFMSEGRYRALLCLVGVVVPDEQGRPRVELIDPLDDGLDPTPLAEVLADPAVEVVLHAGRQDVALLRRVWRTEVRGLFDTQVAAGFAGFGAQTGYGSLLHDVLGLRLAKSASFTRWDDRPLSPEQLAYARDDVAHLLRLADALQERLAATGRLQWAREEGRRLEESSDERDPWLAWQRLPRIGQLNPRARAVARELAAWREQTAAAEDRPVASVLGDAPLIEVAKRRPATTQALERIRGLQPSTLRRRGLAIVAAVARGLARRQPGRRARHRPVRGPGPGQGAGRRPGLRAGRGPQRPGSGGGRGPPRTARAAGPDPPGLAPRPGRRRAAGAAGRPPLPGRRRRRPPADQPPLTRTVPRMP